LLKKLITTHREKKKLKDREKGSKKRGASWPRGEKGLRIKDPLLAHEKARR